MNYPYVYKLIHNTSGQFYFGYREANRVPAELDLGKEYFTSSPYVKELGFDNFESQILAVFINPDRQTSANDAFNFEQLCIQEHFRNPLCLNKHYVIVGEDSVIKFKSPTGRKQSEETKEKIRQARAKQVFSDADKEKMRQAQLGKTRSESHRQANSEGQRKRWSKQKALKDSP